jgi:hypothetical protein
MHAHAPAALRQRASGGKAGKTRTYDFGVSFLHRGIITSLRRER